MKLGAEDKKKVIALGVLVLLAVGSYWYNSSDSVSSPPARPAAARPNPDAEIGAAPVTAPSASAPTSTMPPRVGSRSRVNDEFHPVLRAKGRQGEAAVDPNTVDPTIHLELLAKVQGAKLEGGQRNLFQFGAAPPPELKGPEPNVKPVVVAKVYDYPREYKPPPPPAPKVDPPPPPPTFKYYGLATKKIDNKRTAFFLDGEDIILATEGMTVKGRWKLLRIGAESVTLEDSQTRKQQPLAISEEAGGQPGSAND